MYLAAIAKISWRRHSHCSLVVTFVPSKKVKGSGSLSFLVRALASGSLGKVHLTSEPLALPSVLAVLPPVLPALLLELAVLPPVLADFPPALPDLPPVFPDLPPVLPDLPPVLPDLPPVAVVSLDLPPVAVVSPVFPDLPPVLAGVSPVSPDFPPVLGLAPEVLFAAEPPAAGELLLLLTPLPPVVTSVGLAPPVVPLAPGSMVLVQAAR